MADVAIILDNAGNDKYLQTSREFLTSPVEADLVRIILTSAAQISNIIKIRNERSTGGGGNRDISIGNYVNAMNKSNLIIEVPLDPPILLDGQTYFETVIEAQGEIDLLFFVKQKSIGNLLE